MSASRKPVDLEPPRFSVVVPAPTLDPIPAVVRDLCALGRSDIEVLVAIGANPSRQRNLAAERATGEVLVFLDSDCRVGAGHFERIASHMAAGRRVVGGPVLLEQPAQPNEELFQNFFAHPLLTGPSSARYRAFGALRRCHDAQLILCNLAVERNVFATSGGFDERLYPNEENEWMARLSHAGEPLWHDPDMSVRRPQRASWGAFFQTLSGYGRGRTEQSLLSGEILTARHLPLIALAAFVAAGILRPRDAFRAALVGWLAYAGLLRLTPISGRRLSTCEALQGPALPLFYGIGQLLGLRPRSRRPAGRIAIHAWRLPDPPPAGTLAAMESLR